MIDQNILDFSQHSMCYSPFSLFHALLILTQCANDESIAELKKVMSIDNQQLLELQNALSKDESIQIASNIFSKYIDKMTPAFVDKMMEMFHMLPEKIQSVEQINKWCADHTNNKITNFIQQINFDTIILSAIHFKANWQTQFETRATTK